MDKSLIEARILRRREVCNFVDNVLPELISFLREFYAKILDLENSIELNGNVVEQSTHTGAYQTFSDAIECCNTLGAERGFDVYEATDLCEDISCYLWDMWQHFKQLTLRVCEMESEHSTPEFDEIKQHLNYFSIALNKLCDWG